MKKKDKTTYEKFINEPLWSELLIAALKQDHVSVSKLAAAIGKVTRAVERRGSRVRG
jgi:hypothetical protein